MKRTEIEQRLIELAKRNSPEPGSAGEGIRSLLKEMMGERYPLQESDDKQKTVSGFLWMLVLFGCIYVNILIWQLSLIGGAVATTAILLITIVAVVGSRNSER